MFPASVFRTARGSSRSRTGWIVGVLALGGDHTHALGRRHVNRRSRAQGAPDPPRTNERYSRVRTPAVNTVREMPREAARWRRRPGRRKDVKKSEKKVLPFPTPPQPVSRFPKVGPDETGITPHKLLKTVEL